MISETAFGRSGISVGTANAESTWIDIAGFETESGRDAFARLIGRGRPFHVRKDSRSPEDVVATITAAGGLAVIAHPGVTGADALMPALVAAGLRGIEAYHADHTLEQREHYAAMAARQFGTLHQEFRVEPDAVTEHRDAFCVPLIR